MPKEFVPAVRKGAEEALAKGILGGYPLVDVKVRFFDGSFHEVDSSEMAFKIAGSLAVREAALGGRPQLLEPLMSLEVVVPEEFLGDVIGDVNARRGRVEGFEERGAYKVMRALVPLAQMFGYATVAAIDVAGAGDVLDAVHALRGCSGQRCRGRIGQSADPGGPLGRREQTIVDRRRSEPWRRKSFYATSPT